MISASRPRRASPARARTTASRSPAADPAHPGVDVAADRHDLQPQVERAQLGDPPGRAGAHRRARGQLAQGQSVAGDERVARVLPLRHGGEDESGGRRGGQVLVAVDGEVDGPLDEGRADRRHEDAGATELRDGRCRAVALGAEGDEFHLAPVAAVIASATACDWVRASALRGCRAGAAVTTSSRALGVDGDRLAERGGVVVDVGVDAQAEQSAQRAGVVGGRPGARPVP